jgi:hypothetical protein
VISTSGALRVLASLDVFRRGEEHQGEATLLAVVAIHLHQAELVAVKVE